MRKKILVTGGAGFIGSNLCERLAADSLNEVYSLDNYFSGTTENHVEKVTYINGSTMDIHSLIDFTPEQIYHLGEYSRVEQSFEDIEKVWRFNKEGLFRVIEFAKKTGAMFIYSGSSTKFGDGGLGRSQSPYAWTKASNTELIVNYGRWFNIPYAITYFYNVYGRREVSTGRYATLIGVFREKMKAGEPLTIVRPGTQKRIFTHVDDVVRALILIAGRARGDDFGIGSSDRYSIIEVAELFGGETAFLPERRGNRMDSDISTSKTEALGWIPDIRLKNYIEKLRQNGWEEEK